MKQFLFSLLWILIAFGCLDQKRETPPEEARSPDLLSPESGPPDLSDLQIQELSQPDCPPGSVRHLYTPGEAASLLGGSWEVIIPQGETRCEELYLSQVPGGWIQIRQISSKEFDRLYWHKKERLKAIKARGMGEEAWFAFRQETPGFNESQLEGAATLYLKKGGTAFRISCQKSKTGIPKGVVCGESEYRSIGQTIASRVLSK